jgi:hypothetical protein
MNRTRTTAAVTGTALALLLALTACGAETPGTVGDDKPAASASQPAEALETPSAEPAAEDKPEGPAILAWGETLTYTDGLAISVSQPTGYAPSEWAAGTDGFASFVILNVTVTNGTAEAFDPIGVRVAATSGGVAASDVFDSAMDGQGADLGMAPSAAILPGQSVTWAVGYGVANTADLTVDVSGGYDPDFSEYQHGFWQGAAA